MQGRGSRIGGRMTEPRTLLALAMIVFVVASFGLPLGMVVFGLIAAWEAFQGKWYRLPYLGLWLEKQMYGGFLKRF